LGSNWYTLLVGPFEALYKSLLLEVCKFLEFLLVGSSSLEILICLFLFGMQWPFSLVRALLLNLISIILLFVAVKTIQIGRRLSLAFLSHDEENNLRALS
jgi:hypothetical protein